jgi:hypothetical protein
MGGTYRTKPHKATSLVPTPVEPDESVPAAQNPIGPHSPS